MPGQPTPATARHGGAISRRHAALLLQSGIDGGGGVCVKDLRIRRVVPLVSASLDYSSPECTASQKPVPVERTPEAVPAAVEELERKPVLPRSKLVRDPGSFGYRRLLPFLNQMVQNDGSNCKDMPSENTSANSAKELKRSRIWLLDESTGVCYREGESDPPESAEPMVVKTEGGPEMKDVCGIVGEETNTVPHDLAGSKPYLTRCTRSRLVHHQSSFSYKRMLPFLMKNEMSSHEGGRVKIRRVAEEDMQLTPDENDVSASGNDHLAASEDSSSECKSAQIGNIDEEKPSDADGNHVLENRQLQSAASSPECTSAEVKNVIQEGDCILNQDPLASWEGESTSDGMDFLACGKHLLPVSENSPEEYSRDVTKTIVHDKALDTNDGYVLESALPEVCSLEDSTSEEQKATEEQPLNSDGDEGNTLTLVKGGFLAEEKPQVSDIEELSTAQDEGTAEFPQVPQCQSSDLGRPDIGFGNPTGTVLPSLNRCSHSLEQQDIVASLDDLHLEAVMISRPSDPCADNRCLSVEEMSGSSSVNHTESGSSKAGTPRPSEALSLGKRGSPKKLSPKRGILKRHTRGCKGICMCLDCSTYRLHADRAFEFSRKQMQEADDIIGNLLKEMANLRSLVQKPAGQREPIQAACRRASQVEVVARDRCHQMFVDLNSHCRIPGPRVRFAQYVEERLGSSPGSSRPLLEDNMGLSSPRRSSFGKRRT